MTIKIIGTTAEGKTSISNLIFDLLKSHGFQIELTDGDIIGDYTPHLRSIKEKGLKIKIETIQSKSVAFSPTHVVIKTIDDGVFWPIGQFIQLKSDRWYDEDDNWLNCNSFAKCIKEI
jgi:type IV secretory pathway ATPase VirB11/archaellum biosynthesis ATPase